MSKLERLRVDLALIERGLSNNRSHATRLIMAGQVYAGEARLSKPGQRISASTKISVRGPAHPWVSRGGIKLNHALEHFDIKPEGRTALDLGASTGGFTDVLLSKGAAKVYAIDVGYGQLDWKLRNDTRVVVLEKTNARYLNKSLILEPIDIVVCDTSFISLQKVLPAPLSYVTSPAYLVALIKPQFEAARAQVGKGGVVRDSSLHAEISDRIEDWLNGLKNWTVLGVTESPITGPKGNKEFLIAAYHS